MAGGGHFQLRPPVSLTPGGTARLSLREGAGPFRCLGRLSVRPRPYQFGPPRLDPVRVLIADNVGIGKTIEAALIARELLSRGEAQRLCVLCPPALGARAARLAEGEVLVPLVRSTPTENEFWGPQPGPRVAHLPNTWIRFPSRSKSFSSQLTFTRGSV